MTSPNSNPSSSGNGLAATPQEEILLIHVGLAALTVALGSAGVLWLKGSTWLVAHQVLVPAAAHPVLTVPGAGGAGLDLPRVAVAAAVVVALVACALSAAWQAWRAGEDLG